MKEFKSIRTEKQPEQFLTDPEDDALGRRRRRFEMRCINFYWEAEEYFATIAPSLKTDLKKFLRIAVVP